VSDVGYKLVDLCSEAGRLMSGLMSGSGWTYVLKNVDLCPEEGGLVSGVDRISLCALFVIVRRLAVVLV